MTFLITIKTVQSEFLIVAELTIFFITLKLSNLVL